MLTGFTIFVLVALFLLYKLFAVVPMRENWVIERLGEFRATLEPGFHLLIPLIDNIAFKHEMREQILDIPAQSCITRDNIQVSVDGLVYLKVLDAHKASYGIGGYQLASINLAQTTMRSEIGKLTLGQAFKERDRLNESIVKEIDKASDPWGIKVLRYELRNITPSNHVVHTLEQQMEAEREKRAEITRATAEKQSKILISEGERQEAINLSEGEKQKTINEAKGRAREISIVADATATGIQQIAAAIQKPGGDLAVKMRLVDQYIDDFQSMMKRAKVSILPMDLAQLKGIVKGLSENITESGSGK